MSEQIRARSLERMRLGRLELWRIRGETAQRLRQPRQAPPAPGSTTPEAAAEKVAAWLAGYDGRRS